MSYRPVAPALRTVSRGVFVPATLAGTGGGLGGVAEGSAVVVSRSAALPSVVALLSPAGTDSPNSPVLAHDAVPDDVDEGHRFR